MSDSVDRICKAVDLAERSLAFYDDSLKTCESGPGKELFGELRDKASNNLDWVMNVQESLTSGKSWVDSCTLPEEEIHDLRQTLSNTVDKHDRQEACDSEIGAAELGLDMEKASVDFYTGWKDAASDDLEREFAGRMLGEHRSNVLMLAELQHYFDDPEGWAMSGGLDGA